MTTCDDMVSYRPKTLLITNQVPYLLDMSLPLLLYPYYLHLLFTLPLPSGSLYFTHLYIPLREAQCCPTYQPETPTFHFDQGRAGRNINFKCFSCQKAKKREKSQKFAAKFCKFFLSLHQSKCFINHKRTQLGMIKKMKQTQRQLLRFFLKLIFISLSLSLIVSYHHLRKWGLLTCLRKGRYRHTKQALYLLFMLVVSIRLF